MQKARGIALGLLTLILPQAFADTPAVTIVTLGDSITKGVRPGVRADETFSALLAVDLKAKGHDVTVINAGVGGEQTDGVLKRLERDAIARKPRLVPIMYGTNDSWINKNEKNVRLSLADFRKNLVTIVRKLRQNGIEPILMTEPCHAPNSPPNGLNEPPNLRLGPYMEACREIARTHEIALVDHYASWLAAEKKGIKIAEWTTDGYHPNPRGHREMATLMLPVVVDSLERLQKPLDFKVQVDTVFEHDDRKCLWYHPRAAAIPGEKGPSVLLTLQKHLAADDHYSGLSVMRSDDLGKTWSKPDPRPELDWRDEDARTTIAVADVTPGWHAATKKCLAIGTKVRYTKDGKQLEDKSRSNEAAYAVYDPATDRWTEWKMMTPPGADKKFHLVCPGCVQWLVEPDGSILIPVYFKAKGVVPYTVTVLRCTFDGSTMKYIEHGTELTINVQRGLSEPSLARHRGRYYLTLRNDVKGYVAVSEDGLKFEPIVPWKFDDGAELGSYNTQQHWLTHRDGLFLIYTRRGAKNDHIIRNGAPLFIAHVDLEKLHAIRSSERVLIPERGAELRNFGASAITDKESWVTVCEGIWDDGARKRGAKGALFVARLIWSRPNRSE